MTTLRHEATDPAPMVLERLGVEVGGVNPGISYAIDASGRRDEAVEQYLMPDCNDGQNEGAPRGGGQSSRRE